MSHKKTEDWYASWFDTPFYHILYKDRDQQEADNFIERITSFLNIEKQKKLLDFPCGKGRHSVTLNKLGYSVTGIDLSEQSIAYATQFSNSTLNFSTHDIRVPMPDRYDVILNLFTSFGYFDSRDEDERVIRAMKGSLKSQGLILIDFMNCHKTLENLKREECKTIEGIDFFITRSIEDDCIVKHISFIHEGYNYHFKERVRIYYLPDFEMIFNRLGLSLKHVFGNYHLDPYTQKDSERLILIANERM